MGYICPDCGEDLPEDTPCPCTMAGGDLGDEDNGAVALRAAHVERARYHADLARRRYLAVDPANRLVAGTLEAGWNTALRALNDALAAYDKAREQHDGQLTGAQKARIAQLATGLPGIWNDPATPCASASASPGCCSPTSP